MIKKSENFLDTKGFECPIPVLKTNKFIKKLKKNSIVHVESDDPLSKYDFENYCKENKFEIISIKTIKKVIHIIFKI